MRTITCLCVLLVASMASAATRYRFTGVSDSGVVTTIYGAWQQQACTNCATASLLMSPTASGSASDSPFTDSVVGPKPHLILAWILHTARLGSTTLSGTISMGLGVREQLTGADFLTQLFLYVMAPDGSNRGTLFTGPIGVFGSNTEWQTSGTHGAIMLGASATSTVTTICNTGTSTCDGGTTQTMLDGDRIVAEFGAAASSDGRDGHFWVGTVANDICATGYGFTCSPTCDTQDACIGFIEFSLTIPNAGTPTQTPTITSTPTRSPTVTPTSTGATATPTLSNTPTRTLTSTPTLSPTSTPTSAGTATITPTFTRTPTASNFYGSNDPAAVSPTNLGGWNCDETIGTDWTDCRPSEANPDITGPTPVIGSAPAERRAVRSHLPFYEVFNANKNVSTNPFRIESLILVSDPLDAQNIPAGPAGIHFPIYELHPYFHCTLSGRVWVRKSDGTARCTIIGFTDFAGENSSNVGGSCVGAQVTSTPCSGILAGERLVGEIGIKYATSSSNRDCYLYWASPEDAGDCGVDGRSGYFQLPGNVLLLPTPTFTPTWTGQPTGTPTRTPTSRPSCGPAAPTSTPSVPPTLPPQSLVSSLFSNPSTPTVSPTPTIGPGTPAAASTPFLCATTTPVTGNAGGYTGVNALCAPAHICSPDEILHTIDSGTFPVTGNGWVADGPSSNITLLASDCSGFTTNNNQTYGRRWSFAANATGGRGTQLTCDIAQPVLCCCN